MSEYLGMTIRDLNRKCSGSIFRYQNSNEFYQLESVAEPGDRDRGREVSIMVPNIDTNQWAGTNVGYNIFEHTITTFPQIGYFNSDRSAYHLQRNASRQWHVGYNSGVVHFKDIFRDERRHVGLPEPSLIKNYPKFIDSVFNRVYPPYVDAVEAVQSGRMLSCAFNNMFCIAQSLHYNFPVLMYKGKPIGFIQDDGVPVIFPPAEYVASALPIVPIIKEDHTSVTLRNKWN